MTLITNCSLALPATLNISITIHSVSSSTQSQLLTIPGRTSVLRQKLYCENASVYSDSLYWQFYFSCRYSLCNSVLSVILLKLKWNILRGVRSHCDCLCCLILCTQYWDKTNPVTNHFRYWNQFEFLCTNGKISDEAELVFCRPVALMLQCSIRRLRPSVCRLKPMTKRYILEQKLLWTVYKEVVYEE